MNELSGEQVLMRIFIGESDKRGGKPAYQGLVEMLRREGISGATVFRGILGFGARSYFQAAHILRLSQDLPIVVEVVDSQDNLNRVLPQIEQFVTNGLVTTEKVHVLRYGINKQ